MSRKNPSLIIIAGPNGSGKTTITKLLIKHKWGKNHKYINADLIAKNEFGDWNSIDAIKKAAQKATELRYNYVNNKIDFMYETVFSSEEKIDFVNYAMKKGYFIKLFYLCTDNPTINAKRVARRVLMGGHDVPIPKIISRYYKSLSNLKKVFSAVDFVYLWDNSIDNYPLRFLSTFSRGNVEKIYTEYKNIPRWTKGFIEGKKGVNILQTYPDDIKKYINDIKDHLINEENEIEKLTFKNYENI